MKVILSGIRWTGGKSDLIPPQNLQNDTWVTGLCYPSIRLGLVGCSFSTIDKGRLIHELISADRSNYLIWFVSANHRTPENPGLLCPSRHIVLSSKAETIAFFTNGTGNPALIPLSSVAKLRDIRESRHFRWESFYRLLSQDHGHIQTKPWEPKQ